MRLGVDYGGTNLKMGVFSEEGAELRFREEKLADFTQGRDLAGNIISCLKAFTADTSIDRGGFASKGLVNTARGMIEDDIGAGSLLAGIPLRERLVQSFGVPFFVENDARAYAWGEWKFGAGRGSRVMLCMTLGTGLGCSLVVDGKPYEGADPLGGILGGHISIDHRGPECACGNRGCLEGYCSATAMHALVRERHPELDSRPGDLLENFFASAYQEGGTMRRTFDEFLDALAIGIVNAVHAYGPDTVVLGGGVMNSSGAILPPLIRRVHKRAWTVPRGSIRLVAASLGNRAAALGVAFHPRLQ